MERRWKMMTKDRLIEVQEALCEFIIKSAKGKISSDTVQVLPETVKALIELNGVIMTLK